MQFFTINETGRANLVEFLRNCLKHAEHAERHANAVCDEFDGSDIGSSQTVEVRGAYTRTGNPEIYTFDKATELMLETVDAE